MDSAKKKLDFGPRQNEDGSHNLTTERNVISFLAELYEEISGETKTMGTMESYCEKIQNKLIEKGIIQK